MNDSTPTPAHAAAYDLGAQIVDEREGNFAAVIDALTDGMRLAFCKPGDPLVFAHGEDVTTGSLFALGALLRMQQEITTQIWAERQNALSWGATDEEVAEVELGAKNDSVIWYG